MPPHKEIIRALKHRAAWITPGFDHYRYTKQDADFDLCAAEWLIHLAKFKAITILINIPVYLILFFMHLWLIFK